MTSQRSTRIGVVLIEPVGVVRASLRMLFDAEPGLTLLGEAANGDAGLQVIRKVGGRARLAVVGLELAGDRDSLWLIRSIRNEFPELVVLATGTDLNRSIISKALFVGADGFIHKNSEPERFVDAIRHSIAGELVLEGLPRGALGEILDGMGTQAAMPTLLTERELAVLSVAGEGLTAREIGRRLGMQERTVTTHLNHIYRKLGASGRVAALAAASRMGLVAIPVAPSLTAPPGPPVSPAVVRSVPR